MVDESRGEIADAKDYSHKSHRRALGIPEELNNRPVLYLSSHRGVLDAKYPGHVELFKRTWKGEKTTDEDKEYAYLDLTTATQDEIITYFKHIVVRDDPSRHGEYLPSNTGQNEPLPGFLANVQYIPPLDNKGNAKEPSQTFGIDPSNARYMLKELKNFLEEKGILKQSP